LTLADGRYQLERSLGEGGSADVWQATDTALGVPRAIKLLSGAAGQRVQLRGRLQSEARAMARLSHHPHILRIYDIGRDGEHDYVVMELATGGSLADRLEEFGPMSPAEAIAHTLQVLAALAAAHAEGIVHRDVKPHNVLLDSKERVLLADFGIAKLHEEELRTTRTGAAMGSLAFMAPEQRLDARSVGPPADLYAVGTMLYNLLTCENPIDLFAARPDSSRWDGVPQALRPALYVATAHEPADRHPDARAMALELIEAHKALALRGPISVSPDDDSHFPTSKRAPAVGAPVGRAARGAITFFVEGAFPHSEPTLDVVGAGPPLEEVRVSRMFWESQTLHGLESSTPAALGGGAETPVPVHTMSPVATAAAPPVPRAAEAPVPTTRRRPRLWWGLVLLLIVGVVGVVGIVWGSVALQSELAGPEARPVAPRGHGPAAPTVGGQKRGPVDRPREQKAERTGPASREAPSSEAAPK